MRSASNPVPAPCTAKLDIDEAILCKLSRAELQKFAKVCFTLLVTDATDISIDLKQENKVKANMKSKLIIQELLKLCKVVPLW
jgi:hypothetical protein